MPSTSTRRVRQRTSYVVYMLLPWRWKICGCCCCCCCCFLFVTHYAICRQPYPSSPCSTRPLLPNMAEPPPLSSFTCIRSVPLEMFLSPWNKSIRTTPCIWTHIIILSNKYSGFKAYRDTPLFILKFLRLSVHTHLVHITFQSPHDLSWTLPLVGRPSSMGGGDLFSGDFWLSSSQTERTGPIYAIGSVQFHEITESRSSNCKKKNSGYLITGVVKTGGRSIGNYLRGMPDS